MYINPLYQMIPNLLHNAVNIAPHAGVPEADYLPSRGVENFSTSTIGPPSYSGAMTGTIQLDN